MTPYESVRLAGAHLTTGESVRGVCPWCHGGRTREESFLITRSGSDLKYVCFRATCTGRSSGVLSQGGNPSQQAPVKPKERENVLRKDTYSMSPDNADYLRKRFQFSEGVIEHYRLTQTEAGDIVVPLYNHRGLVQGHERKIIGGTGAKSIRHNGVGADGMAWYNSTPPSPLAYKEYRSDLLLLVEDVFSAIKGNAFMHSAALLGTYLSPANVATIASLDYLRVILALDADATAAAARQVKRYRTLLPQMTMLVLDRDIKDTKYSALAHVFNKEYQPL